jgi:methylenetetrahydrofolate dehydrogenase (NADP+) / methenyltetrahydrofolate cyclohydrolase
MTKILDGKEIAGEIKSDLARKIAKLSRRPGLSAILVGDDPASSMYIGLKEEACKEVGIDFHKYTCGKSDSKESVLEMIDFLNKDKTIDGIIVQLPLPKGFDTDEIIGAIDSQKDVDGFVSKNIIPPTINAVIELLKATGEELENKKTLIIGKSDIFISGMDGYLKSELSVKDIKVEHQIPKDSNKYDVIVIALGRAGVLKETDVKDGVIVIDVGINSVNGKTVGDVDESVKEKAGYLSPVPGGVGPLTVALLLHNTYQLSISENQK